MTQPQQEPANDMSEEEKDSSLTQEEETLELTEEVNEAQEEPASADDEVAALKDQLLRTMAEMENIRKRAQRDVQESGKYAITGFARQLVSVMENLQRASESMPEDVRNANEHVKNLADGVDMTLRELLFAFEKNGIHRITPEPKEKFDHNFHQAMAQVESADVEPGHIIQVMQSGYRIHDRLLQPAMVVVAKRGEAPQHVDTEA